MAQSNPSPQMDLRDLRTTFLEKQLAYALSYEYQLNYKGIYASGAESLRLRLEPGDASGARVFHVLGDDRVRGLDDLGHDLPTEFQVRSPDETVVLRVGAEETSVGSIEGRLILEAPDKGEMADGTRVRISVSYYGTLRLPDPIKMSDLEHAIQQGIRIRASAYVIPFFETLQPKYHWLTENASVAFGRWDLNEGVVTASFDVYSAE